MCSISSHNLTRQQQRQEYNKKKNIEFQVSMPVTYSWSVVAAVVVVVVVVVKKRRIVVGIIVAIKSNVAQSH